MWGRPGSPQRVGGERPSPTRNRYSTETRWGNNSTDSERFISLLSSAVADRDTRARRKAKITSWIAFPAVAAALMLHVHPAA